MISLKNFKIKNVKKIFSKNMIELNKLIIRKFSINSLKFKIKTSSKLWLARQKRDPFVKKAHLEDYRARSAFKLLEIDEKYKFIHPGDVIIDVGAAPGSWSQIAIKKTNSDSKEPTKPIGMVISIDLLHIAPLDGAHLLTNHDITHEKTVKRINELLNGRMVSSVISDMAPNATGDKTLDHDSIVSLQHKAFDLSKKLLKPNGYFLCKLWSGDTNTEFIGYLLKYFESVKIVKPKASRDDSSEIFLMCLKFKKST